MSAHPKLLHGISLAAPGDRLSIVLYALGVMISGRTGVFPERNTRHNDKTGVVRGRRRGALAPL